jgi:hypothetical protein
MLSKANPVSWPYVSPYGVAPGITLTLREKLSTLPYAPGTIKYDRRLEIVPQGAWDRKLFMVKTPISSFPVF